MAFAEVPKLFVLIATVDTESDPDLEMLGFGSWARFLTEIQSTLSYAGEIRTSTHSPLPRQGDPAYVITGIMYAPRVEKARLLLREVRERFHSVQLNLTFVDNWESI